MNSRLCTFWWPIVALIGSFLGFAGLVGWVFSFNVLTGDPNGYWTLSYTSQYLFNPLWMPGYPFLLWLARSVTFSALPPAAVMQLLSGAGYVLGGLAVFALFWKESQPLAWMCAGLYALFPFTGVSYAVFPVADSLALAALAGCFYFYRTEQWRGFALSVAAALLLQKITWFFLPLLLTFVFLRHKQARIPAILSVLPLGIYLLLGAVVKHDLFWFSRWSAEHLLTSRSALPILDGVFGPFLAERSPVKLVRAGVVLAVFLAALFLLWTAIRQARYGDVFIPIGLLLMAMVVNQYEIWSLVRFAKLLSIPFGVWLASNPGILYRLRHPAVWGSGVLVCLASNIAYLYYLTQVFY